jgi:hypothetical protein
MCGELRGNRGRRIDRCGRRVSDASFPLSWGCPNFGAIFIASFVEAVRVDAKMCRVESTEDDSCMPNCRLGFTWNHAYSEQFFTYAGVWVGHVVETAQTSVVYGLHVASIRKYENVTRHRRDDAPFTR